MPYTRPVRVEFNHCDPAGIVFFARYYEMFSSVVENFFRDELGWPFEDLLKVRDGVPTVTVNTAFSAPSRLGDLLTYTLAVQKVGRSSLDLKIVAHCDGQLRVTSSHRIVHVSRAGPADKALPWPEAVRARLDACCARDTAA